MQQSTRCDQSQNYITAERRGWTRTEDDEHLIKNGNRLAGIKPCLCHLFPKHMQDLRLPAKQAWQGTEQSLQKETAKWLKKELFNRGLPQLALHSPNERKAHIKEMASLKLQGVLSGASDWIILIPRGPYHGLVVELKKGGGVASLEQKLFLQGAADMCYLALLINDLDVFKQSVTEYLDQK